MNANGATMIRNGTIPQKACSGKVISSRDLLGVGVTYIFEKAKVMLRRP